MSRLKKSNDGTTFLLTVIDVFSKRAWCIPLKNKSAASLVAAFTQLLRERQPITLQTDKGSEFLNRSLQKLLKQYGVHHFSTHNEETKASIVERFNRTLKTRMWRYFTKNQSVRYLDVLQDFVRSYNKTYHRSIGMAPSEVNGTNQESVWQRIYGHEGGGTPSRDRTHPINGLDSSCKPHVTRAYQSVVWKILEWKHVSHVSSSTGITVWTFLRAGKLYITDRRGPSTNVSYFHYRSGLVFTRTHKTPTCTQSHEQSPV